jgi:hypothetical protein
MPIVAIVLAVRHHMRDAKTPWAQSDTAIYLRMLLILVGVIALAYLFVYATSCGGFLAGTFLDPWTHAC